MKIGLSHPVQNGLVGYVTSLPLLGGYCLYGLNTVLLVFALRDGDLANFTQLSEWEVVNLTSKTGTIPELPTYAGVILLNEGTQTATVSVDFLFTFRPSFYQTYNRDSLTTYDVNETNAVILDPTLDQYGFPGYAGRVTGEKTAIDPVTRQYVALR